ncbi:hypothetical protein [Micromonospora sp. NPDC093277]|uniref:hypothetical protein n=1 Tax=Micromonospora sp. NPDC093277 TaxID=3364291 RepID=UPI00380DD286
MIIPAARLDRALLRRRVLPVAMVVCWLVWTGLSWWTAPRTADRPELDHDLAAGRVVTWFRADGWAADNGGWGGRRRPRYASEGAMVVWTRPDGQIRYAIVGAPVTGASSGSDPLDDGLDRVAGGDPLDDRLYRVAGSWDETPAAARLADAAGWLAVALGLGWLVVLVAGPPPVAGTRWYWFWIGSLPFGVGLLAWAYRERWRGDVPPVRPRRSGWVGLGWMLLGGLLLSVAVAALGRLLGDYVVPAAAATTSAVRPGVSTGGWSKRHR